MLAFSCGFFQQATGVFIHSLMMLWCRDIKEGKWNVYPNLLLFIKYEQFFLEFFPQENVTFKTLTNWKKVKINEHH